MAIRVKMSKLSTYSIVIANLISPLQKVAEFGNETVKTFSPVFFMNLFRTFVLS